MIQVGVEDQREGELTVRFRHKKANFGSKFDPFEAQLLFHATQVEIRHRALSAEEAATEGSLNTKQKIRRLLEEGPMFPEELEEKIDAELPTIKNKLSELRREKKIEDTGVVNDTGARQVRLVRPPSSTSQPNGDGDDDDGLGTAVIARLSHERRQGRRSAPMMSGRRCSGASRRAAVPDRRARRER